MGLKPTYGAVSRYGMIAFASSLDQAGPLTRDVTDAALLLRHMVGADERDSTATGVPDPIELPTAERLDGLRFGVPPQLTGGGIDPGVREVFDATLKRIEELGGTLAEIDLPHAEHAIAAYYVIAPAEASANLARFDGVRYGRRADDVGDLLSLYEQTREQGFGDEVKRRIMIGTYALSSGYYDAYYGSAQKVRTKILDDFRAAYEQVDLIVTPAAPTTAFGIGELTDDPLAMYQQDFCTVPFSLAGLPGISIPGGWPTGCRWASSWPAPPSARTGSWMPRTRWSRPSASTREAPVPEWEPVIGLEIHVQLQTKTKMFCGCELSFGEEPNTRTCPTCLGLPGALPVANAEAVHYALMIGMALGCEIAPRSIFHRKNYFYPDSPKAYQISQYDIPICGAGRLGDIRIHRAHLEEDAAKLVHAGASGRIHSAESSRRGLQPLRHAAGGDRDRARRAQRPAGLGVAAAAAGDPAPVGRVGREHGGGLAALRRQRVDPAEGLRGARDQDRAEEHEQLPLPRARGRRRDRAPDRHRRRGRHDHPGDAALRPPHGLAELAALEGGGARLPLLPRARPGGHRADRSDAASGPGRRCPSCPPTGRGGWSPSSACPPTPRACWRSGPSSATCSRPPRRRRRPSRAPWPTGSPASSRPSSAIASRRRRSSSRRALGALVDLVDDGAVSASAAKEVLGVLLDEGGEPAAIVEDRGLGKAGGDELSAIVDQALADNPDVVEKIKGGNPKAIGALDRAGDEGHQGHRRRRRGPAPGAGEAGALR